MDLSFPQAALQQPYQVCLLVLDLADEAVSRIIS